MWPMTSRRCATVREVLDRFCQQHPPDCEQRRPRPLELWDRRAQHELLETLGEGCAGLRVLLLVDRRLKLLDGHVPSGLGLKSGLASQVTELGDRLWAVVDGRVFTDELLEDFPVLAVLRTRGDAPVQRRLDDLRNDPADCLLRAVKVGKEGGRSVRRRAKEGGGVRRPPSAKFGVDPGGLEVVIL